MASNYVRVLTKSMTESLFSELQVINERSTKLSIEVYVKTSSKVEKLT